MSDKVVKNKHDVKSNIHALSAGVEVLSYQWDKNPEFCLNLLNLMEKKITDLKNNIVNYQKTSDDK